MDAAGKAGGTFNRLLSSSCHWQWHCCAVRMPCWQQCASNKEDCANGWRCSLVDCTLLLYQRPVQQGRMHLSWANHQHTGLCASTHRPMRSLYYHQPMHTADR
jgi:hypothetical protein